MIIKSLPLKNKDYVSQIGLRHLRGQNNDVKIRKENFGTEYKSTYVGKHNVFLEMANYFILFFFT